MSYIKPSRFFYPGVILMVVCSKASSPVNIVSNVGSCDLKCHYSYNYPQAKLSAYNRGEYLEYEVHKSESQQSTHSPVNYNNSWYEVTGVRIYAPSLHQYGGKQAAAELMIFHRGVTDSMPLVVSVPIQDGGSIGGPTSDLDAMVSAAVTLPTEGFSGAGGGVPVNLTGFTLNSVVPTKPFYSYTGSLPFSPPTCGSKADLVVFDTKDSVSVTSSTAELLRKHITDPGYPIKPAGGRLFFNKTGARRGGGDAGEGIYIDCQPTGQEGETLVAKKTSTGPQWPDMSAARGAAEVGTQLVVGGLIMALVWVVGDKIVS
jgi:carbonic anhydrase